MLAMYVVLENADAMVCDYPEAYENQPGFDFIQNIPTTWEETVVLDAQPDRFLVIARKKKNEWWIGGVTGDSARQIKIHPVFFKDGITKWKATVYQDDLKTPFDPNGILVKTVEVDPSTVMEFPLAAGGGFTIKLEKL
jgi:alpha-glucosidase